MGDLPLPLLVKLMPWCLSPTLCKIANIVNELYHNNECVRYTFFISSYFTNSKLGLFLSFQKPRIWFEYGPQSTASRTVVLFNRRQTLERCAKNLKVGIQIILVLTRTFQEKFCKFLQSSFVPVEQSEEMIIRDACVSWMPGHINDLKIIIGCIICFAVLK